MLTGSSLSSFRWWSEPGARQGRHYISPCHIKVDRVVSMHFYSSLFLLDSWKQLCFWLRLRFRWAQPQRHVGGLHGLLHDHHQVLT